MSRPESLPFIWQVVDLPKDIMPLLLLAENPRSSIFERFQPPYTAEKMAALVDFHREVMRDIPDDTSYYINHVAESAEIAKPFLVDEVHQKIRHRGGELGSFTAEQMAVLIHEQMRAYIEKETMGQFPVNDQQQLRELVSIMIRGFSADSMMAMATGIDDEEVTAPLASARATVGQESTLIKHLNGSFSATLPTLAALQLVPGWLEICRPDLANTPAAEVACIGRFSVNEKGFHATAIDRHAHPFIAVQVLAILGQVMKRVQEKNGNKLQHIIYDTHRTSKVVEMSSRYFNGQVIAAPTDIDQEGRPVLNLSPLVLKSALNHHYGAYAKDIFMMTTTVNDFIAGGEVILQRSSHAK